MKPEQSWLEIITRADAAITAHQGDIARLKKAVATAKRMIKGNVPFPTSQADSASALTRPDPS